MSDGRQEFTLTIIADEGPLDLRAVRASAQSVWAASQIPWRGGEIETDWTVTHIESGLALLSVLRVLERDEAIALADYLDKAADVRAAATVPAAKAALRVVAGALLDYPPDVVDPGAVDNLEQKAGRA